jgi:mannan endo-1,4-beta-mannosidase
VLVLVLAACTGGHQGGGGPTTSGPAIVAPGGGNGAPGTSSALGKAPAARKGTGQFEVDKTEIFDPAGRPFVPVGTNMNGPNSFFDVPTKGQAATLQDGWGFNTVRLVTCLSSGCQGATSTANNDLPGIVAEYTARKMVVMIDYHQLGFGAAATSPEVQTAVGFWTDMAKQFKNNPYVWFNLFNEPEANFNDYKVGLTAPERWRAQHQPVISAIRAAGANNVIVIDDTQAGQGAADWWSIGESPAADSGILAAGPKLVDPAHRLVFSVHAYDVWGFPNDNDPTCRSRYTDAQRDARFASYVDRVHGLNLPLIIGELGFRPSDNPTSGVSYHGESGGQPPCGSTMLLAAETVYRVAPARRVGVLVWHGFDLTTDGAQAWKLSGNPPSNLTHLGQMQYQYIRQLGLR